MNPAKTLKANEQPRVSLKGDDRCPDCGSRNRKRVEDGRRVDVHCAGCNRWLSAYWKKEARS